MSAEKGHYPVRRLAVVPPLSPRGIRTGTATGLPVAGLPGSGPAAGQPQLLEDILHPILSSIFQVGMVLSSASGMPSGSLQDSIDDAVQLLDDVVRKIYGIALNGCGPQGDPARRWAPPPDTPPA